MGIQTAVLAGSLGRGDDEQALKTLTFAISGPLSIYDTGFHLAQLHADAANKQELSKLAAHCYYACCMTVITDLVKLSASGVAAAAQSIP